MGSNNGSCAPKRCITVGIWLPLPQGAFWRGEGIGRTIEFVIDGFRQSGRLGQELRLVVYATSGVVDEIRDSLHSLLDGSVQGLTFVEIPSPLATFYSTVNWLFTIGGLVRLNPYRVYEAAPELLRNRKLREGLIARISGVDEKRIAATLGATQVRQRVAVKLGIDPAAIPDLRTSRIRGLLTRAEFGRSQPSDKAAAAWESICAKLAGEESPRLPGPGILIAKSWLENAARIPLLGRVVALAVRLVRGRLARRDSRIILQRALRLAKNANVDVWWVPSPTLPGLEYLPKRVVVNFWDCVGAEFGYLWGKRQLDVGHNRLKIACHRADVIITQSFRNRDTRLANAIRVPLSKVAVCYLTTPLRYRSLLPEFDREGRKTVRSKEEAAEIVRSYVDRAILRGVSSDITRYVDTGMQLENLLTFDFARASFAIVSTQNRPYKNVPFIVDAFLLMIDRYGLDSHLFLTCPFNFSDSSDPVAKAVLKRNGIGRVFSLPRIPNKVHAALYHCASCTLHPSLSEGGVGSYPFLEGMAVGTPGLSAACEYMTEGLRLHPQYRDLTFSPRNRAVAARQISVVLRDPASAFERQRAIFDQHAAWTWRDVAAVYESCFRTVDSPNAEFEPVPLPSRLESRYFSMPNGRSQT
jgi:glycosyltransferase involved in cell wall biosynthesis